MAAGAAAAAVEFQIHSLGQVGIISLYSHFFFLFVVVSDCVCISQDSFVAVACGQSVSHFSVRQWWSVRVEITGIVFCCFVFANTVS